jgi:hypothetical protein
MAGVGGFFGVGAAAPTAHYDVGDYTDGPMDSGLGNAAVNVAVMVVVAAVFLTVLKRSGFRAMVAVGRG